MKNTYFIIRHGESEANVQGIIASSPEIGVHKYGLTEKGRKQVSDSFLKSPITFSKETIIVSSDFLRTKHTAEIIQETLKIQTVEYNVLLRERYFGDLEGKNHKHYSEVWIKDRENPDNKEWGIESPQEVLTRALKLIGELEERHEGKHIILVGHGDPLQILYTGAQRKCPSTHMLAKILNAELREVIFEEGIE